MMWKARFGVILLVLLLVTAPYLLAVKAAGPEHVFGGFFLNPLDGNTYLAKMRQGWEGAWQFRLPYTAEPGQGSYLFLFYLFLGHTARILGASLLFVFHAARLGAALFLLLALERFYRAIFPRGPGAALAFVLAALGSGMGWLAALAGWVPADMWVAEAYPFLAAFTNPHFPLGMALMVLWLTPAAPLAPPTGAQAARGGNAFPWSRVTGRFFASFATGLLLALLSPFGAILAGLVAGGSIVWEALAQPKAGEGGRAQSWLARLSLAEIASLAGFALGSAPLLIYDFWIARAHPVLAGWNAQNIISVPPAWDLALSLSPALLLAILGTWMGRTTFLRNRPYRLLFLWAALGLLLIAIPTGLRLRFSIGLFIPLAGLAAAGVARLATGDPRRRRNLLALLFGLSLPNLLFIQLAALFNIQSHPRAIYLARGEAQAMAWLDRQTPQDALILAAPDSGLFIPARTDRRVIYGHPYETVPAQDEKEALLAFFGADGWDDAQRLEFLARRGVDYLFFGPRERALGEPGILEELRLVYEQDGVAIYAAR